MMSRVRMTHPTLPGQEITVDPGAVPHHRAAGWQVVEGQEDQGEQWPAEVQRFEGQPQIRIYHPVTGGEAVVAASAVPIHEASGWQVVQDAEPQAEPEDDLAGLTVAELQDLARGAGLPVSGTKAELLQRLRSASEDQAGVEPAQPTDEEA